ncbi:MAG TPA: ribokinase [Bauldia sp.]|nr:ribokinase [Bauldia sp.]
MAEGRAPRIVVIGSVHMDLIASAERLPGRGESVSGGTFAMAPGGKAGNQACQCALAGAGTHIVTRLGDDTFGRTLRSALERRGVDTSVVVLDREAPTGASTVLAAEGDYQSIIAPGAAGRLTIDDIEQARPAIEAADALILQLEIPVKTSAVAAAIASRAGRTVVLNASPAPEGWAAIPEDLRQTVSVVVVNRMEAGRITGHDADAKPSSLAASVASRTGADTVLLTLGAGGAIGYAHGMTVEQPAFPTEIVDTVGAGDAFLGTAVVALLEGRPLGEALRRGAAAGAIAVSRRGVYEALPTRADVDAFLGRQAA